MTLDQLIEDVRAHAATEAPRECCGVAVVIKGRLRYWPCRNIATEIDRFEIEPDDYAAAEDLGEIVGICHSHVFLPPVPSDADKAMCEHSGVPWLIVNHPTGTHQIIEPSGYEAPLVGRQFTHGVLDCYQIIVDHYQRNLGIKLPYFARSEDWWLKGQNLYLDGFEKAGFVQVGDGTHTDIRTHDVLVMQVASPVPNHAAIYLGDGVILQHLQGRLSSRDVYGGYWSKHTSLVLRHQSLL
jgi:proteasome lid subunit RPN8/RPN11